MLAASKNDARTRTNSWELIKRPDLQRAPPSAKLPSPHRLSDRRDDRDALPARGRRSSGGRIRLHLPSARGAAEAKVSAFINARFDKIDALKPDLVLAFSDLQADIARD